MKKIIFFKVGIDSCKKEVIANISYSKHIETSKDDKERYNMVTYMEYSIFAHKDKNNDYEVTIPNLPG